MACLGVHFSLDEITVEKLKSFTDEEERLNFLQQKIEEDYFDNYPQWVAETDKAWDAIHRSLTNGRLEWENGDYPLNHVILGGEPLYMDDDYIMSLKTPRQVRDIAQVIKEVSKEIFKNNYYKIDPQDYGFPLDEEDFEYTWENFEGLKEFWFQAAEENRYVLFTADQ